MITNIALIGCAHIHVPGFIKQMQSRDKDVLVKTVWDHDQERGQQRADELTARFIGDVDTILGDPEIKAVVICSETHRHRDLVTAAAHASKDLFVEKPLGMGARDASEMAGAIEAAGVKFQTGYAQRGLPQLIFLKEQIEKGTFGRITRVRGSNCHSGALGGWFDKEWRWMADPKLAGCGAFGDLGTHALDIMLWWLGKVSDCTATLDTGTRRYGDCDELGEALLRFENCTIATLASSWDDVANPVSYLVSGTEAHAAIINGELFFTCRKVEGADGKSPWTKLPPQQPAGFEAFLDAISGKPATLVSAREAAYRSSVMESLYQGARERRWMVPQ
jgi:predicted dehydrogenase